jgi:lipopolysaccharide cholinephosphotransferase
MSKPIKQPILTDKNLIRARKVLFDVVDFFESEGIDYWLEGGTLLGIVRDHDLLPWDHDIDLSIPAKDAEKFAQNIKKLNRKGYRVTQRRMHKDIGAFKDGEHRIFKVKRFIPSILKIIFSVAHKHMVVADIFVKASDDQYTYWQAMEKIMRVDKKYYSSFETVEYLGRNLRVPSEHRAYLTEKYGDWSTPIKNWSCGADEKTVIGDAYK